MKKLLSYFSPFEWGLSIISSIVIICSYLCSKDFYFLTLIASLVGVFALTFLAKGNVIGQFLTIVFGILYSIVSVKFRYYGELITYLFMSVPAAACACISWLKHPSKQGKSEVKVATMSKKQWIYLVAITCLFTMIFYFILRCFHTPNLFFSTLSVTTSTCASVLVIFRSRYYAVAYACNDIVLIILWTLAAMRSLSYLPVIFCFAAFLVNDLYAFYNWKRLQTKQQTQDVE
jgi:nicotinamide mononucleotide transporter PnuC